MEEKIIEKPIEVIEKTPEIIPVAEPIKVEIKEEIKNGMGLKFSKNIAERTSLLHGGIQFEKYPEISDPDILKIGKELNEDAELAPFRTEAYGLRQRSKLEIEESKSRLEQQRLENK